MYKQTKNKDLPAALPNCIWTNGDRFDISPAVALGCTWTQVYFKKKYMDTGLFFKKDVHGDWLIFKKRCT